MKKKILASFITFFLLLSFSFSIPLNSIFAEESKISLSVPKVVKAGDKFNVSVRITNWKNFIGSSSSEMPAVWFSTSDTKVKVPPPYIFVQASNGIHTFTFFDEKAEDIEITVFNLRDPKDKTSAIIHVIPNAPKFIKISPENVKLQVKKEMIFSVTVKDEFYNDIPNPPVRFEVSNNKDSIDQKGLFTAKSVGDCLIIARVSDIKAVAKVSVVESTISNVSVFLSSLLIHTYPDYTITFIADRNGIKEGSPIFIFFPDSFMFPCTCHKIIQPTEISVNGKLTKDMPKIYYEPRALEIFSPVNINPFSSVKIEINKSTEIKTPQLEGKYKIGVGFNLDDVPIFSQEINISFDRISHFQVQVSPSILGVSAEYKMNFLLGKNSVIKKGDYVLLQFPKEIHLPNKVKPKSIVVNNKELSVTGNVFINNAMHFIKIYAPESFLGGSNITILIKREAGIVNPVKVGKYKVKLSYADDILPVSSDPFSISYQPFLTAQCEIKGNEVKQGIYNSNVKVNLKGSSNIPYDSVTTFYSVNEVSFVQGNNLELSDGSNRLTYFSVDKFGIKSKERVVNIYIDTIPPKISIQNLNEIKVVHTNPILIKGKLSEKVSSLTLNGTNLTLNKDLEFASNVHLTKGDNLVTLVAVDNANNRTLISLTVRYIPERHFLSVKTETSEKITYGKVVNLVIKTNRGSVLTLIAKDFVKRFKMNDTDTLFYRVPLRIGENNFTVYSKDGNGDFKKQELQILRVHYLLKILLKKNCACINGKENLINFPLKNVNGRIFISIMDFAKVSNCRVDFNYNNFSIENPNFSMSYSKRDKAVLFINNKSINSLENNVPFKEKGIWYIPIRFVLEKLGYTVLWNGQNKVITIYKL